MPQTLKLVPFGTDHVFMQHQKTMGNEVYSGFFPQ